MSKITIKSKVSEYDPFSDQRIDYQEITLNESVIIRKLNFINQHTYLVQDGKSPEDPQNYEVPFDDPDVNLKSDYCVYRDKVGFLSPEQIKKIRQKLNFSLRETSAILGISYSALSEIENGVILQSEIQDNLLRMLLHPYFLVKIIEDHKQLIQLKLGPNGYQQIINKIHAQQNWDDDKLQM